MVMDLAKNLDPQLYPIEENGKWGYIDSSGKTVIEPQFKTAHEFLEGFAFVETNSGSVLLLDAAGKTIKEVPGVYDIQEGVGWVGYSGLVDKEGNLIQLSTTFDEARPFCNGVAWVNVGGYWYEDLFVDGKWGLVDRSGRILIEPRFDHVQDFREERAFVEVGLRWGVIDKSGEFIVEPHLLHGQDFHEGLAWVVPAERDKRDLLDKWGLIDSTGKVIIAYKYSSAKNFSGGVALVGIVSNEMRIEGGGAQFEFRFGLIDRSDNFLVQPVFAGARDFSEGVAWVRPNDRYGLIDRAARFIIEPAYDYAEDFASGVAWARVESKLGIVDTHGVFNEARFDELGGSFCELNEFKGDLAKVRSTVNLPARGLPVDIWGYMNKSGRIVWVSPAGFP